MYDAREQAIEAIADFLMMQPAQEGRPSGDYYRALADGILNSIRPDTFVELAEAARANLKEPADA
jgi:hypothetical protein